MSQCPCARAAPARTQKAPTAAAAYQAMWHWPSPTTVCLRQPRARQQHSSRGEAVGVPPLVARFSGTWWCGKGSPGLWLLLSPLSLHLQSAQLPCHLFLAVTARAELPGSVPPSSPPAPASATAEPPQPSPQHLPECHIPRGLAGHLLPCSSSSSPHPAERLGSPLHGEHHCCTDLAASLTVPCSLPQDTALREQPWLPKAAAQPRGVVERMGVPQPAHPAAVPRTSLPLRCAFVPRAGWGEWAGFQLSFCKVGDFF